MASHIIKRAKEMAGSFWKVFTLLGHKQLNWYVLTTWALEIQTKSQQMPHLNWKITHFLMSNRWMPYTIHAHVYFISMLNWKKKMISLYFNSFACGCIFFSSVRFQWLWLFCCVGHFFNGHITWLYPCVLALIAHMPEHE